MAKAATKTTRKKVKKTVIDGVAHIYASFKQYYCYHQLIVRATHCRGLPLVVPASADLARARLSPHRLQRSALVKPPRINGSQESRR